MQIYYPDLQAIEQRTMQLDLARCQHCKQPHHLVSHGYIRKKQIGAAPLAVGKRVFCSNRHQHAGCGRTMQLYLAATVRYLHHAGCAVAEFVLALIAGMTTQSAYQQATGTRTPRHAYRWLQRLNDQLSTYRSVSHRPALLAYPERAITNRPARLLSLLPTMRVLAQRFGQPLCATYQQLLQRPFV